MLCNLSFVIPFSINCFLFVIQISCSSTLVLRLNLSCEGSSDSSIFVAFTCHRRYFWSNKSLLARQVILVYGLYPVNIFLGTFSICYYSFLVGNILLVSVRLLSSFWIFQFLVLLGLAVYYLSQYVFYLTSCLSGWLPWSLRVLITGYHVSVLQLLVGSLDGAARHWYGRWYQDEAFWVISQDLISENFHKRFCSVKCYISSSILFFCRLFLL